MILAKIRLSGFRNFKKTVVNLEKKSLIIGANDVGKTNLLWALRLLLDRSLSDYDIEPKDSDFYAYEETNEFKIHLVFKDVKEDCVVSKLKGKISSSDELILEYRAFRDPKSRAKSFKLYAGPSPKKLEEIEDRYYRKVLNLKYIGSSRNFHSFINKEKNYLFEIAKEGREEPETQEDEKLYKELKSDLEKIDGKIPKLNFVSSATNQINEELSKLSLHHKNQKVVFDAASSNVDQFIRNVSIASNSNGSNVEIGGDGRLNQIYLALWASRNELTKNSLKEVTIFCIEEPEAHLHPHQQRKLADYLNQSLHGQVLTTSHSAQITSEFSPNSIIRLYNEYNETLAASDGCSEIIEKSFDDFGYRMSIIPAEAFFADVVLLVEGPSESLFYKTLANQLDIDLDRMNISILQVDGIGFKTFVQILEAMKIDWVVRTDNDIFKVPKKEKYRYAGVQRCIELYRDFWSPQDSTEKLLEANEPLLTWGPDNSPKPENIAASEAIISELVEYELFLASKDLETDLLNSPLKSDLHTYFDTKIDEDILKNMQSQKATFMYNFLKEKKQLLKKLSDDGLAKPLKSCVKYIEMIRENEAN